MKDKIITGYKIKKFSIGDIIPPDAIFMTKEVQSYSICGTYFCYEYFIYQIPIYKKHKDLTPSGE